jgi:hypothetical protein
LHSFWSYHSASVLSECFRPGKQAHTFGFELGKLFRSLLTVSMSALLRQRQRHRLPALLHTVLQPNWQARPAQTHWHSRWKQLDPRQNLQRKKFRLASRTQCMLLPLQRQSAWPHLKRAVDGSGPRIPLQLERQKPCTRRCDRPSRQVHVVCDMNLPRSVLSGLISTLPTSVYATS